MFSSITGISKDRFEVVYVSMVSAGRYYTSLPKRFGMPVVIQDSFHVAKNVTSSVFLEVLWGEYQGWCKPFDFYQSVSSSTGLFVRIRAIDEISYDTRALLYDTIRLSSRSSQTPKSEGNIHPRVSRSRSTTAPIYHCLWTSAVNFMKSRPERIWCASRF